MTPLSPPPREKSSPLAIGQWLEEAWRKINALITGTTSVTTVTGATTLTSSDDVILANPTSAGFTITFPTAGANPGKVWTIKNIGTNFNIVTLSGPSTTLNTEGETVRIYDDGAAYRVIDRYIPSAWETFTATGTMSGGTVTYTAYRRRKGDSWAFRVKIAFSGVNTQGEVRINIPDSQTIDTAKLADSSTDNGTLGLASIIDNGTAAFKGFVKYNSTTTVVVGYEPAGGTNVTQAAMNTNSGAPMTIASGDYLIASFEVPISGWAS